MAQGIWSWVGLSGALLWFQFCWGRCLSKYLLYSILFCGCAWLPGARLATVQILWTWTACRAHCLSGLLLIREPRMINISYWPACVWSRCPLNTPGKGSLCTFCISSLTDVHPLAASPWFSDSLLIIPIDQALRLLMIQSWNCIFPLGNSVCECPPTAYRPQGDTQSLYGTASSGTTF